MRLPNEEVSSLSVEKTFDQGSVAAPTPEASSVLQTGIQQPAEASGHPLAREIPPTQQSMRVPKPSEDKSLGEPVMVTYGSADGPELLRTGTPIDILRGGADHDIFDGEVYEKVLRQAKMSLVTLIATECKTFSRARDKEIPGAKKQPPRLRSCQCPHGLPHVMAQAGPLREKIEKGNKLAFISALLVHAVSAEGKYFLLENPGQSYIWNTAAFMELEKLPGAKKVFLHNCMYGGLRRKYTCFLTNIPEADFYLSSQCTGTADGVCSATGKKHLPWAPIVAAGGAVQFLTEDEAEYPQGLASSIALVVQHAARVHRDVREECELDFTEIFSGPNAPTTMMVGQLGIEPLKQEAAPEKAEAPTSQSFDNDLKHFEKKNEWTLVRKSGGNTMPRTTPAQQELTEAKKSQKEIRRIENRECLGGLRSPWRAVKKLPKVR